MSASGSNTINITATNEQTNYVLIYKAGSGISNTTPYTVNMPDFEATLTAEGNNQLLLNAQKGTDIVKTWQAASLQIYPNPTNSQLRIINVNIQIVDVIGHVVETLCNASLPVIDISHLENGLYFLKIGDKTVKVIKN